MPLKNSPNTNNVFRNIQFVCFSKHIFFLIFAQNVCISNKKNKQLLWNNNTKKKNKKRMDLKYKMQKNIFPMKVNYNVILLLLYIFII